MPCNASNICRCLSMAKRVKNLKDFVFWLTSAEKQHQAEITRYIDTVQALPYIIYYIIFFGLSTDKAHNHGAKVVEAVMTVSRTGPGATRD